jgi:hypothetical protein
MARAVPEATRAAPDPGHGLIRDSVERASQAGDIKSDGGRMMTNETATRSLREQLLGDPAAAARDRYSEFADMAEAYVARTVETICEIGVATSGVEMNPDLAARMTDIRARIDGLGDLIVRLRELQAEGSV